MTAVWRWSASAHVSVGIPHGHRRVNGYSTIKAALLLAVAIDSAAGFAKIFTSLAREGSRSLEVEFVVECVEYCDLLSVKTCGALGSAGCGLLVECVAECSGKQHIRIRSRPHVAPAGPATTTNSVDSVPTRMIPNLFIFRNILTLLDQPAVATETMLEAGAKAYA